MCDATLVAVLNVIGKAKGISMKNNDSINGAVETLVIGKSAAKNSAGNMRTRYNDKINISEMVGKLFAISHVFLQ